MELEYSKRGITFQKQLNALDEFTIGFCRILDALKIRYVIVSGYVAILFGRNRASEDIDILTEKITFEKFGGLWKELMKHYDCVNPCDMSEAYHEYFMNDCALRFSRKGTIIPNAEVKFASNPLHAYALGNRMKVTLNDVVLFISPLEMQIPYKITLGSDKDLEDARFLYKLFKDKLDKNNLKRWLSGLKVKDKDAKECLGDWNE